MDRIELFSHTGCSVSVTGLAAEITDPAEEVTKAHIPRWAPTGGDRLVTVSAQMVSGRRIVPGLRSRPEED